MVNNPVLPVTQTPPGCVTRCFHVLQGFGHRLSGGSFLWLHTGSLGTGRNQILPPWGLSCPLPGQRLHSVHCSFCDARPGLPGVPSLCPAQGVGGPPRLLVLQASCCSSWRCYLFIVSLAGPCASEAGTMPSTASDASSPDQATWSDLTSTWRIRT